MNIFFYFCQYIFLLLLRHARMIIDGVAKQLIQYQHSTKDSEEMFNDQSEEKSKDSGCLPNFFNKSFVSGGCL